MDANITKKAQKYEEKVERVTNMIYAYQNSFEGSLQATDYLEFRNKTEKLFHFFKTEDEIKRVIGFLNTVSPANLKEILNEL